MTSTDVATEKSAKKSRLPIFLRRGRVGAFLSVVFTGQMVYVSFEAFKGSLMLPFQQMLGISQTEYGVLMAYIGAAMFFYVPAGWINNRFKVRTILIAGLTWRLITFLILFIVTPSFVVMSMIAMSWALVEACVWPSVLNGVSILSSDQDQQGKGLAMGLLESIRRFMEFAMNGIIIIAMMIWADHSVQIMRGFAIGYSLLLIPMIWAVWKFVPDTRVAEEKGKSNSVAALNGLFRVLTKPRVWLAGLSALTVYWCYVNLIYSSAPYLSQVFHVSDGAAAAFGIFNTGLVGVFAGLISGFIADYVFKSSGLMLSGALGLVTAFCVIVIFLPEDRSMMWVVMVMLILVALGTFLAKAVFLAPLAELNLPEGISGSAMSVGSFMAYAPAFWGYALNGMILDAHLDNPGAGYEIIFLMTAGIALLGCLCAGSLGLVVRRERKAEERAVAR